MSKWKTDEILTERRKLVAAATQDWPPDQLREKLAVVLAAVYPIKNTLYGLIDNPSGPHSGMTVTSDLFLEDFGKDLDAHTGLVLGDKDWVETKFRWSEKLPEGLQTREASFDGGEVVHDDTDILSVCQYATACSIFVGSFDGSDVRALINACSLPTVTQEPRT